MRAVGAGLGHASQRSPCTAVKLVHERQIEIEKLIAQCSMQVNGGHAPGFAYGARASGHRHVIEVRDAFGICKIGYKKLAAPELAVGAESKSIHSDADHRAVNFVVCHATGDVGVMMLYADLYVDLVERQSVFGRQVFRMQIISD